MFERFLIQNFSVRKTSESEKHTIYVSLVFNLANDNITSPNETVVSKHL